MASDMKKLLKEISVSEEEVARYREGLAARLPSRPEPRRIHPLIWGGVLAATILIALIIPPATTDLGSLGLEELETGIAENPDHLRALAQAQRNKDGLTGLNAILVLSMTGAPEESLQRALEGLQQDPRPEVRMRYLETLLDSEDTYLFDRDLIDRITDRETDPVCFDLLSHLSRRASSNVMGQG